jgi:arginase
MKVIIYAANAGDRNPRAMRGSVELGATIAQFYGVAADIVGEAAAVIEGGWAAQLSAALPNLRSLAVKIAQRLDNDEPLVLTTGRCAASLATLPMVAQRYPDAAIVWFDAHGDSNLPDGPGATEASYLGGMVITGAAGEWRTGLGEGLNLANVILVGARDLDPPEQARIDAGEISLVPPGAELGLRLREAIRGRQLYIHLDCDVLTAGLLATEYQVAGGLQWRDLLEAFEVLGDHDVLGLEIAEYEASWPDGRPNDPNPLLAAIQPVLRRLLGGGDDQHAT